MTTAGGCEPWIAEAVRLSGVPYRAPARERMRYVRYCLDVLTKPTPCAVPWDSMDGTECERTCLRCDKQVYDLTAMDPLYADDFLREHMPKPPHVELRRRPDGRFLVQECGPGARQRIANGIGKVVVAVALGAALLAIVR